MNDDVTAGQDPAERFAAVFAAHQPRVHSFILAKIGGRDWHLAEDLTSETFLELYRSYTARGRALDDRVVGLLATIARRVIAHHFRLARNTREVAADFTDYAQVRRLPVSYSAEDWAVENLTRDAMLANAPVPMAGPWQCQDCDTHNDETDVECLGCFVLRLEVAA
ncbi:RNA polymerase sigma factor [Streptomyces sp. URMC 129]|uniref:RNA polymerase sigma factor n=1 Tax=Streptomyces sp. URMC 129 TaxID=3423407 RepID=UPI003F1E3C67